MVTYMVQIRRIVLLCITLFTPSWVGGYDFHHSIHLQKSNHVKGAMEGGQLIILRIIWDLTSILIKINSFVYVWANWIEIGSKLTDAQKSGFPDSIPWNFFDESQPTTLKNPITANVIGKIVTDPYHWTVNL